MLNPAVSLTEGTFNKVLDMNLFIYVLLLSIWTNNCLDRHTSNGSDTAVATYVESRQRRVERVQQWILTVIIVVLIISFILRCYCFIHYGCLRKEAYKAATVKKEDISKASMSSKISFTDFTSLTAGPGDPEKQPMLSSIDKISGPSSPQKASVHSSAEKLVRPSCQQNPSKPSTPKKVLGSLPQEKLHRTHGPKKAHRRAHAHKHGQVSPSYPKKAIKPTWSPSLQCLVKPTKTSPPYPKSQSFPEQSNIAKLTKLKRHLKLKSPASEGRAEILSRPRPVKFCQCYKEKCLVCSGVSEPLITHISEENMKHVSVPLSSCKLKCFYKSSHNTEPKDNTLYGNMNDSCLSTYSSDRDSDREMTIMCDIRCKEATYKTSQNN